MLGQRIAISMICLPSFQGAEQKSKVLVQASSTPLADNDYRGSFLYDSTQRTEMQRGGWSVSAVPGKNQTASVGAIVRARLASGVPGERV